jgi:dolichol-phosphate mannosyltransferase
MSGRILVFTATYNEADNISALVAEVFAVLPGCDMLVVDDNSPDGTGDVLDGIRSGNPRLHVVHRPGKNGLGSAHKLAFKFALAHGYDALITMDADFSHDPKCLPQIARMLETSEFVIGSRYMPGGSCELPLSRVVLSRTANTLARTLLGLQLRETTTAYRGFRRGLLERMDIDAIRADGYSFFVESIYQVSRCTQSEGQPQGMAEFPIRFVDRRAGTTKISRKEIWKGFTTLARLAAGRITGAGRKLAAPRPAPQVPGVSDCKVCGSPYHVELYPAAGDAHRSATYQCTSVGHANHGRIVQCLGCGLVFTNPQLSSAEVLALYAGVEDQTYLENVEARIKTFSYNLDAVERFLPPASRMLEVGSYCGFFLDVARKRGFDVLGVEPSVWASAYARDTLHVPTVTGGLDALPDGTKPFDVVCSWDVLEHLSDPMAELKLINRRLRPGGVFAFSTLDYANWVPRLLGERWPWMMDMHLYYFTTKMTTQMLERAGFRLLHQQSYRHIVTLDYLLSKLTALGIPGAAALRAVAAKLPTANVYVPFYFGDIQLYVCEKFGEVDAGATESRWPHPGSRPPVKLVVAPGR